MSPESDDRSAAPPASRRDALRAFDAAAHTAPPPPPQIPPGRYRAEVLDGQLSQTASGKETYQMTFAISDGPFTDYRLRKRWYFTDAAVQYTRQDLGRFGLTTAAHLQQPFPRGRLLVDIEVGSWVGNNGIARHDVKAVDPVEPSSTAW